MWSLASKSLPKIASLAVICTALAGCLSDTVPGYAPQTSNLMADRDAAPDASGTLDTFYQIGGGDRLKITVFGQPSLSGQYNVDGAGLMSMPLIGGVQVGGLTTREIESRIAHRLGAKYLRNPNVTVEVLNFRPFFILGQVNRAGQYPYVSGMDVRKAVAIAGGYSARANQKRVKITRKTQAGQQTFKAAPQATVYPGDTIYVRERWF